jgi:hypothetical protein
LEHQDQGCLQRFALPFFNGVVPMNPVPRVIATIMLALAMNCSFAQAVKTKEDAIGRVKSLLSAQGIGHGTTDLVAKYKVAEAIISHPDSFDVDDKNDVFSASVDCASGAVNLFGDSALSDEICTRTGKEEWTVKSLEAPGW